MTKKTDFLALPNKLRTDPDLGTKVRAIADRNYRSISAQILLWIEQAVQQEQREISLPRVVRGGGDKSA